MTDSPQNEITHLLNLPMITYAGTAWASNITQISWKKLESTQLIILKTITDSQWFVSNQTIRNSTKISTIRQQINIETLKLKSTISHSEYSHIHLKHIQKNCTQTIIHK